MADNQNQQAQGGKPKGEGPKGHILLVLGQPSNGNVQVEAHVTANGKSVGADVQVVVMLDGIQQYGDYRTDDKGVARFTVKATAGARIKVMAVMPQKPMSNELVLGEPPKTNAGASGPKTTPKILAENAKIGEGLFRFQVTLMDEDTKRSVEGSVRISANHRLQLDNADLDPRRSFVKKVPTNGAEFVVKVTRQTKLDFTLIGWPNADMNAVLEGPPEKPITTNSNEPTILEVLFKDCQ